jgi:hypothetical protein
MGRIATATDAVSSPSLDGRVEMQGFSDIPPANQTPK